MSADVLNSKTTRDIASNQPNFYKNGMKKKELRRRRFKLHWGSGWITEEARSATQYHEPSIQLLSFDSGAKSLRFCYYRRHVSRGSVDSRRVSSGELETRDSKEQNDSLVDEKTCLNGYCDVSRFNLAGTEASLEASVLKKRERALPRF